MNPKYPIMEIVKEKLKAMDKNFVWLGLQTGRSDRWYFGNPEIEKIEYQVLVKLSQALDFDFIADHRKFLGIEDVLPAKFKESEANYHRQEKKITLQMNLLATVVDIQKNYAYLLQVIQDEGLKYGFEIS